MLANRQVVLIALGVDVVERDLDVVGHHEQLLAVGEEERVLAAFVVGHQFCQRAVELRVHAGHRVAHHLVEGEKRDHVGRLQPTCVLQYSNAVIVTVTYER